MTDSTHSHDSTDSRLLTRRRAIGCAGVLAGGGLALGRLATGQATAATVTMGELNVGGDTATVGGEPTAIMLTVDGEYGVDAATMPGQARTVLQVQLDDGTTDDLDENVHLENVESGTYTLQADVLDHRGLDAAAVTPENPDETVTLELLVRVIVLAITDGSIQAENYVEDTATVEVTREGVQLSVGGTGSVTVETA